MIENLGLALNGKLEEISNAYAAEDRINTLRNNLRDEVIKAIDSNKESYHNSFYFMDIISEQERMGERDAILFLSKRNGASHQRLTPFH